MLYKNIEKVANVLVFFKVVPWGLRKLLNWVAREYANPLVLITENGYSDNGQMEDMERIRFINVRKSLTITIP